jgi:hypothetical protein
MTDEHPKRLCHIYKLVSLTESLSPPFAHYLSLSYSSTRCLQSRLPIRSLFGQALDK